MIPSWNESFVFDVASDAFKARSHPPLEAVIFDQDLLKDDVMASFSCDVTGLEIDVPKELWVESADVSSINDAIKAMKKNKAPDPEASRALDMAVETNAQKPKTKFWSKMFGKSHTPSMASMPQVASLPAQVAGSNR